jgi:alpha-glucosidase
MFFRKSDPLQLYQQIGGKKLVDDIQQADRIIQRNNRRFGAKKRTLPPWQPLGEVKRVAQYERGIRCVCAGGWVEVHWVAPDCLRVRLRRDNDDFLPPFSYAVNKVDWPPVSFDFAETNDLVEIRSNELVCRVDKAAFRLKIETLDGKLVHNETSGTQWRTDGGVRLSLSLPADEGCYGLGERASALNLRGKALQLWNAEPSKAYTRDTDPLYFSVPFYLGLNANGARGVLWDNSSRGMVDLGAATPNELTFEAETGELRYYLFFGATVNEVMERYTELTGRIHLPPLWGLGYHQSRFSYFPQDSVLKVAEEFRKHSVPCDALYLDIHYMHNFQVFTWNHERFPGGAQMVNRLRQSGFKTVAALHPGIKVDDDYVIYKSGLARNVFLKNPDGTPFTGALWSGTSHLPDFTNPITRSWWVEQFDVLLRAGVDGVVNDMGEPSLLSPEGHTVTVPDYVEHDRDGLGGNHQLVHNVYGSMMARATQDGLEKHRSEQRPFNVMRSGYAGSQRYGFAWTGANKADWDHLRLSISMALNMNLSGMSLVGADIGGFDGEPDAELFTRWLQAGCLLPYFRNHTMLGTKPQEPWSYGQPYEVINRVTIQLRYRLLAYLYSVVALCREFGYPVVRPLFTLEPQNQALRSVDDSFLVGDALLVAPVMQPGAIEREVYLPKGQWYDFWTNEAMFGGRKHTVPAPLERLPLFVRAGSCLPLNPEMQYVGERSLDELVLRVYPGKGETVLYEDSGDGLDYLEGDYRWVYTSCEWDDNQLIIKRRAAGSFEPSYKPIKVEIVSAEEPADVRVGLYGAPLWFYDDGILEVATDDKAFGQITVIYRGSPSDPTIVSRPW